MSDPACKVIRLLAFELFRTTFGDAVRLSDPLNEVRSNG